MKNEKNLKKCLKIKRLTITKKKLKKYPKIEKSS